MFKSSEKTYEITINSYTKDAQIKILFKGASGYIIWDLIYHHPMGPIAPTPYHHQTLDLEDN